MIDRRLLCGVTFGALLFALSQPVGHGAQRAVQRIRGQNVAPVFDGYEVNSDGTYSLWFGYLNRNQDEHLDVPIGPDNQFEPGPADRGQPTHFVPHWQKSAFKIVVPKGFGTEKLTWRLTSRGKTETVVATLNPLSIIDRQKTTIEGSTGENLAPMVTIDPPTQTIVLTDTATINVSATDDGRPVNPRTKQPEGLNCTLAEISRAGVRTGDVRSVQFSARRWQSHDESELQ